MSLAVPPLTPAEWTILDLLLDADEQGLSVSELVWVIGSPATVAEAIDALDTAGLVTRTGQYAAVATNPSRREG